MMGVVAGVQGLGRCDAAGGGRRTSAGLDEHHRPRGTEGALPGRVSCVRNVETPLGSGRWRRRVGKPTVRNAHSPAGKG